MSANNKAGFIVDEVYDSGYYSVVAFKTVIGFEAGVAFRRRFTNMDIQQMYTAGDIRINLPFDEPYSSGYSAVFGSTLVTYLYDLYKESIEVHIDSSSTAKDLLRVADAFLAQCQKMQRVLDRNEWFAQEDIPDPLTLIYDHDANFMTPHTLVDDVSNTVNQMTKELRFTYQDDQDTFVDHLEAELMTIVAELRAGNYAKN